MKKGLFFHTQPECGWMGVLGRLKPDHAIRIIHSQEHKQCNFMERETEEHVPRHYNRFQMVLEDGADSKHQRKSVILWWGENGRERESWVSGNSSITSPQMVTDK